MIRVHCTNDPTKADLIKSHLESVGIMTYINSNDASGTLTYFRSIEPIEILVQEKDIKLAKEICSNY